LEAFSFNYVNALSLLVPFDYPPLTPVTGKGLAASCPFITSIKFCHYAIDEEGVREILKLPAVIEADFSDNESLHGIFLLDIPFCWPLLRSLTVRDCTEVEEEHVSSFGTMIANGACSDLTYADFSCQWAFFNTSLLHKSIRDNLMRYRGSVLIPGDARTGAILRWREDQCEIDGFGVDPEDGVDSLDMGIGIGRGEGEGEGGDDEENECVEKDFTGLKTMHQEGCREGEGYTRDGDVYGILNSFPSSSMSSPIPFVGSPSFSAPHMYTHGSSNSETEIDSSNTADLSMYAVGF
jgi:hypothetical protein